MRYSCIHIARELRRGNACSGLRALTEGLCSNRELISDITIKGPALKKYLTSSVSGEYVPHSGYIRIAGVASLFRCDSTHPLVLYRRRT